MPRARALDPVQLLGSATPRQRGPATPSLPAGAAGPVLSFEGGGDDGTTIPPDTHAAFSTTHVFNPLNNNIHIYDLGNSAAAISTTTLNAFWGREGCFDPKVLYDPSPAVGRYVFVSMSGANSAQSALLIAVSSNGDPTQPWMTQAIAVDPNVQGNVWMDYPSLGLTDDKVTVQVNLFTIGEPSQFAGSTVYAFDKASLLGGQNTFVQRFMLPNQGACQVPAETYDAGFADQYLVSSWGGQMNGNPGALAVWMISGSVATQSATLQRVGFVTGVRSWDSFPPQSDWAPQSGVPDGVDTGDDRLLSVIYRNGNLHCCHTISLPAGGPSRSSIQWWDIPVATWTSAVGLLDDPTESIFYAYPSMALNQQGDLLIGHAQFSPSIHPSGAYHLVRANGSQQSTVFAPGQASYVQRFSGAKNRWGDYSATQRDPSDVNSFWTIQEYASATPNRWATKIAKV